MDEGDLDAYQPQGGMIVTAVKTRLVHAAVRHLLPQSPGWSRTSGGRTIPISQADIMVTWHSLSTFVMSKLKDWRVPVSSAESDGFLHVWQVTAHMLGVLDEYIPSSWDEADAQSRQVLDPILASTPEGIELTDVLLDIVAELDAGLTRPLINAFSRYTLGDRTGDLIGLDREPFWQPLISAAWPLLVAFREGLIPLPLVPQAAWTVEEALRRFVLLFLKPRDRFTVIGKPHSRLDALAAVTGRKTFTLDLDVPDALPTMVCRPPTINGRVGSVSGLEEVRAMPGVTDVVVISTGVAVRAITFGRCIDAVRALRVTWRPGTAEGKSDASVLKELERAELPLGLPPLTPSVEERFTFHFRSNSALEPNAAIADVRSDRAEIWSSLKAPIVAKQAIVARLGLPPGAVKVHVTEGGGSFGRKLFFDAALEAAEVSQKIRKPVKLMWHRADDSRQGRTHPMATSRVRIAYLGDTVLGYKQRHTSVSTDLGHGLGEIFTALAARLPVGDIGFSETFFQLSQSMPYDFGANSRLLSETDKGFNTGSMRNVYSPDVTCARELLVDRLAGRMGKDPYRFRRDFLRDDAARAVLDKAAEAGNWGRSMPAGTAQGMAIHAEYHSTSAVLVEIDCRPETVDRPIRDGVTGPRVTGAVIAVDVGLAVNPRGLEAQMTGCLMDGIALALTSSLHLRDGSFLEASWDNYFYTRQWNTPPRWRSS